MDKEPQLEPQFSAAFNVAIDEFIKFMHGLDKKKWVDLSHTEAETLQALVDGFRAENFKNDILLLPSESKRNLDDNIAEAEFYLSVFNK